MSFASGEYQGVIICDRDEKAILRTPCRTLDNRDWEKALRTAEKLLYVRNQILKGGAGLAAPQIGLNYPIFIYTPDRTTENLKVVINPSFEPLGDEQIVGSEACFSVPLRCTTLKRWKSIKVQYQSLDQRSVEVILRDFAAKVFQHEMDHLRGVLTIDHEDADIITFSDPNLFQEHMKQIHFTDAKTYASQF